MVTPEQEIWLTHLSNTNSTKIYPFDPSSSKKFEKLKEQIQILIGTDIGVVHRGSTSLGISDQGELDVYIPVAPEKFDSLLTSIERLFGKPTSLYPLERARFVTSVDGTKAEVFVINIEGRGWIDGCRFEKYLKENAEALEAYRKLKEDGQGLSTREYYRRKIEFLNDILSKHT